ncbi:hypothetical protein, partial [Faecalibacterium prausnitzii]
SGFFVFSGFVFFACIVKIPFLKNQKMSQRMAAGSSPRESHPRISHAALLIACDALNARTLTVREYQPACMSWPASSRACIAAGW